MSHLAQRQRPDLLEYGTHELQTRAPRPRRSGVPFCVGVDSYAVAWCFGILRRPFQATVCGLMQRGAGSNRFGMRKKLLPAATLFAFLLGVSCTTFDPKPTPQVTIQALPTSASEIDTQAIESRLGLVFVPATASDTAHAKVSKEDAVKKARVSAPVEQATSVNAELGHLSSPALEEAAARGEKVDPTLLSHPMVWIVSFQGLDLPSSGPPGSTHRFAHEYNVVIDAITGDYLMGFIYR